MIILPASYGINVSNSSVPAIGYLPGFNGNLIYSPDPYRIITHGTGNNSQVARSLLGLTPGVGGTWAKYFYVYFDNVVNDTNSEAGLITSAVGPTASLSVVGAWGLNGSGNKVRSFTAQAHDVVGNLGFYFRVGLTSNGDVWLGKNGNFALAFTGSARVTSTVYPATRLFVYNKTAIISLEAENQTAYPAPFGWTPWNS